MTKRAVEAALRPGVVGRAALLGLAMLGLVACAGRPYEPADVTKAAFLSRAQTKSSGQIRVSAAVPSPEEVRALFGLDLYARGIQPVWIEVENSSPDGMRFAPVSVDREYFAPLEVSYTHRGGFSKQGRDAMDLHLYETAMPRRVPAESTRSGFVYTHARPGTKGFNVDLFGELEGHYGFTFFVDVPGFVADHANVDFEGLYPADAVQDLDESSLRSTLAELGCCTMDASGEKAGQPLSVVLVADGEDLLHALLRAGWVETQDAERDRAGKGEHHWRGRPADATFRMQRDGEPERNDLKLWLAPFRAGGEQVWMALITHSLSRGSQLADALVGARLDPDADDARNYMLQIMWYSQGLARYAWSASGRPTSVSEPASDFSGGQWFSDGYRLVMWISGPTVSLLEATYVDWDAPVMRAAGAAR